MSRAVLSPPNAILFVLDPTNKEVVVPPYIAGELVAATATCVSVGTQADVDGDVEVSLEPAAGPLDLLQVFLGGVATPGGKVAVVTSHFFHVLEINVPSGMTEVVIWVDDLRHPAHVAIGVRPTSVADIQTDTPSLDR